MTPVFCCGFECGVFGTAGQHWSSNTGSASFSTTTIRSGARSLRINPAGAAMRVRSMQQTASDKYVIRFYIRFASLPLADYNLFNVFSYSQGLKFKSSDSSLYLVDFTGPTLGSTGAPIVINRWYLIDIKFDLTSGSINNSLKVDGIDYGGITTGSGGSVAANFDFGEPTGTATTDFFIDDFLVSNTLADYPLGPGKVEHYIPTSDGSHNVAGANDFERSATGTDITNATTTAYQLIDDVPLKSGTAAEYINLIAPPNATDYVEVVFGPAPGISTPTVAPRAVEVIVAHAASGTGTNNIRLALNDNGTTDDVANGSYHASSAAIAYHRKHYADPPSAASVWTLSGNGNFNNVRMRCYTSDAAPDPWWASAMIEAEFAETSSQKPFSYGYVIQ